MASHSKRGLYFLPANGAQPGREVVATRTPVRPLEHRFKQVANRTVKDVSALIRFEWVCDQF